jgi:hypothetical protein
MTKQKKQPKAQKPTNPIVSTLEAIVSNRQVTTPEGKFIIDRLYRRGYIMKDVVSCEYSLNDHGESLLRQMTKEETNELL